MTSGSEAKLKECHEKLQKLMAAVNERYPIQVICGHRNKEDQDKAFAEKKSKLKFPDSKHNRKPSLAVDIVPDPDRNPKTLDWNDTKEWQIMLHVVEQVADEMDIKIRLGRDFKFVDLPHCELI
jgi:peptidoglycan L-alanyl-D-glutamate endopeptidase CwlK